MKLCQPTECVQSSNQECVGTKWTSYIYKLTLSKVNLAKDKPVNVSLLGGKLYFWCLSVPFSLLALSNRLKISI